MAGVIESHASGTTTAAALNTPLELSALADQGVYVLRVNLANLAAAETVKFTATDGSGVVWQLGTFTGVQSPTGTRLGPIEVYSGEGDVSVKLEQTAGTLRAFAWRVTRIHDDTVTG